MRGEILGPERRRRWREEDKLEIVLSVGVDGATLTQVAQRHDETQQQIYTWPRELKKKGLWSPDNGALFLPMELSSAQSVPEVRPEIHNVPVGSDPVPVELRLNNRRRLRFHDSLRFHLIRPSTLTRHVELDAQRFEKRICSTHCETHSQH